MFVAMSAIPFQNHHASLVYYPPMLNDFDCIRLVFVLVSNIADLTDQMLNGRQSTREIRNRKKKLVIFVFIDGIVRETRLYNRRLDLPAEAFEIVLC